MLIDDKFPGADLIAQGLDDLLAHRHTANALLVAIGAPRLRRLELDLPADNRLPQHPEHLLYDLLASQEPQSAHANYNALIRRLVSYERARELAIERANRGA
ncbi:MAG: hypothetical protein HYX63_21160 [Gammaproteobacteria bacterium]|nr:hypothetical protein [Gammaproteobacteria bacterium]